MQSQKTAVQAVIFDLGNVLIKFDARVSSRAFAEMINIPEEEIWKAFFISDMEKAYTRGEITTREFIDRVNAYFKTEIPDERFAKIWNEIFTENTEMEGLLEKLKKRYPLYIISNTNEMHWEYVKREFPILRHFTRGFPSHEMGCRKPDPRMFQAVLQELRLKPEETVFVDDILEFVDAARKAGMSAVQFTCRADLEKELPKLGVQLA